MDYLQQTWKHENSFVLNRNTAVCYIYCNYKQQGEQSARNLISSLIRQVAIEYKFEQIQTPILKMKADAEEKDSQPTLSEYSALLGTLIQNLKKVFIVIDALDECKAEERIKLITEIMKLSASVVFTSREIPDILDLFPNIPHIHVRVPQEDVERYLTSEIDTNPSLLRLTRTDPMLRKDIIDQISERSQGMYVEKHLPYLRSTVTTPRFELIAYLLQVPSCSSPHESRNTTSNYKRN